ncbi:MAG: DeoR/GlpR transcriptional regulator [Clostridia bacterium]|nr:DeoR/GlpR transcriptional regulator [Clostridia bacterium]
MKKVKKTEANERILLKELQLNGCVTLQEAIEKFNISEATARRLFSRLEEKGLGIRSHGKISLPDSTYNFYRYEASEELYVKEKRQIANEAIKLIKSGDVLFLDSGTTVCLFSMALAESIRNNNLHNIKVFTNSYMIINILNGIAEVILVGGTYRPNRKDFCGYMAEKAMKDCHFDKCILGTDGYNSISGFTTTDFESAKICETAIEHSNISIILMDSHKYKKANVVSFSKGENISIVITDNKIEEEGIKAFKRAGINLKVIK